MTNILDEFPQRDNPDPAITIDEGLDRPSLTAWSNYDVHLDFGMEYHYDLRVCDNRAELLYSNFYNDMQEFVLR